MPESVENGYPYVMIGNLRDNAGDILFESCKQISEDDYMRLSQKTKTVIGDVIFARYATIGTVCYVDVEKEFVVSYSCVTVHPKKDVVLGKYLFYYFKSQAFYDEIKQYINSNTQGNVGIEALYKSKIIVPPLEEQYEILTYLDEKCAAIDTLISKKEQFLTELENYKKSLIYEYVTGKKEVPLT
jgi:type I restriction enzyme S subunit